MDPHEYEKLEALDRAHWFYRGKRAIVRHWIDRYVSLGPNDVLIDGGTGTGTWPVEMSRRSLVIGLDDHEESLTLARPRLEGVGGVVLKTTLDRVDLPSGVATVVTLLDVLEHLDDDAAALREMIRLVRPGGLVIVTVPALRWLWSDWDVTLHHRRRYHRADLLRLVDQPEVEVLHCSYFNTAAMLPILLVRLWRRFFPPAPGTPRAEDRLPRAPLNTLLYHLLVAPARWGWFRPPIGVSLLAVLRIQPAAVPQEAEAAVDELQQVARAQLPVQS
jgi:SAM-dependent methyltransferase